MIWLEMRCETLGSPGCHSNIDVGPVGVAWPENGEGGRKAVVQLAKDGRAAGWRLLPDEEGDPAWHCPNCVNRLQEGSVNDHQTKETL